MTKTATTPVSADDTSVASRHADIIQNIFTPRTVVLATGGELSIQATRDFPKKLQTMQTALLVARDLTQALREKRKTYDAKWLASEFGYNEAGAAELVTAQHAELVDGTMAHSLQLALTDSNFVITREQDRPVVRFKDPQLQAVAEVQQARWFSEAYKDERDLERYALGKLPDVTYNPRNPFEQRLALLDALLRDERNSEADKLFWNAINTIFEAGAATLKDESGF